MPREKTRRKYPTAKKVDAQVDAHNAECELRAAIGRIIRAEAHSIERLSAGLERSFPCRTGDAQFNASAVAVKAFVQGYERALRVAAAIAEDGLPSTQETYSALLTVTPDVTRAG